MALDVEKLENSFDLVASRGEDVVDIFYAKVFAEAPEVQPLFAQVDMARQKQSLLNTLLVLRESLRDLSEIEPDLEELGARHAGWGVRPEHYPVVIACLVSAMADVGGADWQPEYSDGWTVACEAVRDVMLRGAARSA
jgi:methyl-accepting chemotaxis protein